MSLNEHKLRLPQVTEVSLERFSLYTLTPSVTFSCGDGVLCLIGANGIGKSTLLAAINYGLTGIVSDPLRRFESIEEYYRFSLSYADSYFSGRILERDREQAAVGLQFSVGDYRYKLKRGLFEPGELRDLQIINRQTSESTFNSENKTNRELHQIYGDSLAAHVGLSNFEQFVFLQHFVFTFDERRKTLFWDQKILELVLYLTFGVDPSEAKHVDILKRKIESADSQVRNYNWEATQSHRKIMEIERDFKSTAASQESYDTLAERHETLTKQLDEARTELNVVDKQLKDATLRLAERSARESALRDEYSQVFNQHLTRMPHISQHPLLITSIAESRCGLCGASGSTVVKSLAAKRTSTNCPICDSPLELGQVTNEYVDRLRQIDNELANLKRNLRDVTHEIERLHRIDTERRKRVEDLQIQTDEFERQNHDMLAKLRAALNGPGGVDAIIESHKIQLQDRLTRKTAALELRDKMKKELLGIQKRLQKQYAEAEVHFVPAFTNLAHLFLGMDLEIRMDAGESLGLNLVVEVKGTTRRQPHSLSESQRFFLDIALRMAITQFISADNAKGGLYIDTPEGSLDIAYEKRAGDMLSLFVEHGHRIIMTANLNSSRLLLALAHNCRNERLLLCRMMDWTELSEVQNQEEALFKEAYAQIEKAMTN